MHMGLRILLVQASSIQTRSMTIHHHRTPAHESKYLSAAGTSMRAISLPFCLLAFFSTRADLCANSVYCTFCGDNGPQFDYGSPSSVSASASPCAGEGKWLVVARPMADVAFGHVKQHSGKFKEAAGSPVAHGWRAVRSVLRRACL